jgi:hypothetical protein
MAKKKGAQILNHEIKYIILNNCTKEYKILLDIGIINIHTKFQPTRSGQSRGNGTTKSVHAIRNEVRGSEFTGGEKRSLSFSVDLTFHKRNMKELSDVIIS